MTRSLTRGALAFSLVAPILLAGCVSQSKYEALQAQNQQLQHQVSALTAQNQAHAEQISRLQGAIKYTVNSRLLFPSGSWHMSNQGQQLIAQFAEKLAPTQQRHLLVNGYTDNVPVSHALQAQGITSNEVLSQKRADEVMHYLISQGVKPDLVSAHGYGDTHPVASNATPAGRAQNRRVEVELAPPGS